MEECVLENPEEEEEDLTVFPFHGDQTPRAAEGGATQGIGYQILGAREVERWERCLSVKLQDLILIIRTHTVEGANLLQKVAL